MDPSPPGSSVHGILQARKLERVDIPFSRGSPQHRDWTWISHIAGRFLTTWAIRKAPKTEEKQDQIYLVKNNFDILSEE